MEHKLLAGILAQHTRYTESPWMKIVVEAHTRSALVGIYDPAAVRHLTDRGPAGWRSPDKLVDALILEADKGNLTIDSPRANGNYRYDIHIDEPQQAFAGRRGRKVAEGFLRVPSGEVVTVGLEFVFNPTREAEAMPLTKGLYAVEVREFDFSAQSEAAAEEAARTASPAGARTRDMVGIAIFASALISLLLLGATAFAAAEMPFDAFWPGAATLLVLLAAWWVILAVMYHLPSARTARQAAKQAAAAFDDLPGTLIRLSRLEDDSHVSALAGCLFGVGAKEDLRQARSRRY